MQTLLHQCTMFDVNVQNIFILDLMRQNGHWSSALVSVDTLLLDL